MNVDDVVREQIERARQRAAAEKLRRQELAAARRRGLAARHARKLFNLTQSMNNESLAASGC